MAIVLSACVHTPKKGGGGGGPKPGGGGPGPGPTACGKPGGNPPGKQGPQGPSLDDGLVLDDRFQRNIASEQPPIPEIRAGNGLPTGPSLGPVQGPQAFSPFDGVGVPFGGGFGQSALIPIGGLPNGVVGELPPPQGAGSGFGRQDIPFQGAPPQPSGGGVGDAPLPKREVATHTH